MFVQRGNIRRKHELHLNVSHECDWINVKQQNEARSTHKDRDVQMYF